MKYVLSLGAGVQSSALAVMFSEGDLSFPPPECAVFADTQAEPQYVYDWLDMLEQRLTFPIYRVTAGNLTQMIEDSCGDNKGAARFAAAPFYVDANGKREGILRRQCTREFKVAPITKFIRELVGLAPGQRARRGEVLVTQYLGISYDEAVRMKPSRQPWIRHAWPLVDMEMRRLDCQEYLTVRGFPMPKKSACVYCPYRDDRSWLEMRESDAASWNEAVRVDERIRAGATGMRDRSSLYVHRSLQPLQEVDLTGEQDQLDMFGDECEGLCGV